MAQNRQISPYLPHETAMLRNTNVRSDLEFLEEVYIGQTLTWSYKLHSLF